MVRRVDSSVLIGACCALCVVALRFLWLRVSLG